MALDAERRQQYQRSAGLTDEQIRQTVGNLTVDREATRLNGLTDEHVENVRQAVGDIMTDCTIISANYNQIALETNRDARETAAEENLIADRELLEDSFSKDYRLTDPNGNVGGRDKTLEAIFSGKIRKETFGPGGFETLSEEFQVRGESAMSIGVFRLTATQMARNLKSGVVRRRPREGTFRSTHTYVFEEQRWRLAASQLTLLRGKGSAEPDPDWVFIDD
jgi:hypothetical protein